MFGKLKAMLGLGDDPETAEAKRRMAIDHGDPRRRWAFGLVGLKHEADPAYLPGLARMAVAEWYGLPDRVKLIEQIRWYVAGADGTPGYDTFRGAFLARAGFGASMLSEAESWQLTFEVGRKVQHTFPAWRAYGMSYLEGHLAYRSAQGDDAQTLGDAQRDILDSMRVLEQTVWTMPFHTPL